MENNANGEPTQTDFGSRAALTFPEQGTQKVLNRYETAVEGEAASVPEVFLVGGDEVLSRTSRPWALGVVIGLTTQWLCFLPDSYSVSPEHALNVSSLAGCFLVPLGP